MLTIVFHPAFGQEALFNKGPYTVLTKPDVHLVFWGPDWWNGQGTPPSKQSIDYTPFLNEATAILSSPFFKGLKEYTGSDVKIGTVDSMIDNDTVTGFDSKTLSGNTAFNELAGLVTNNQLAGPGTPANLSSAPIYAIIVDPADSDGNGGVNGWGWLNNQKQLVNVISVGTDANHQLFGDTFSHEMAERISDPTDPGDSTAANVPQNGVRLTPSPTTPINLLTNQAALYNDASNRVQIGDGEAEPAGQDHYSYLLGGDPLKEVQPFWSAQTGAFIAPDGNKEPFDLHPIWSVELEPGPGSRLWPNGTFSNSYDLTINGDQLASKNDNIRISSDSAGGVEVNFNGEIAYFDPSTANTEGTPLHSITVNGLTGNNTLTIDFTNGDPIPVNGITFNGGTGGTNTIQVLGASGNFVLSNSSLKRNSETINLSNVQVADLYGGGGFDTYDVSGWTGTGTIVANALRQGPPKSTLSATKDVNFTIGPAELRTSDGMDLRLFNFKSASLVGGPSADTFTDNGWKSLVSMTGASGNDTFNLNYSLNPGAVTIDDTGLVDNNAVYINDLANLDVAGSVTYAATSDSTGHISRTGTRLFSSALGTFSVPDTASVSYSHVTKVNINADNNGNTFNVLGIPKGTDVVYNAGKGSDAVTAGNPGTSLDGIGGTLTLNGQGNTTLKLDDEAEQNIVIPIVNPPIVITLQPAYTVTSTSVTRVIYVNGSPSGPIAFNYNNLANLTIQGGQSGNTFDVESTAGATATTAAIPVHLVGGAGDDTFNFDSTAQTLDGIHSLVTVDGRAGHNVVNLYDNAEASSQFSDVLRDQFTRAPIVSGQPGSTTQTINYQSVAALNAHFGSGYQLVGVTSTLAGTSTTLYGGANSTQFIVANNNDTLDDIQGAVTLHGGGIFNLAEIIDALNTVGHNYTLSSDPTTGNHVDRDGMADISYDGFGEFIVQSSDNPYTPPSPSTVAVTGTAANVSTILLVRSTDTVVLGAPLGNGTHTMQTFLGEFRVQSVSTDAPTVVVDDSGNPSTTPRTVTFDRDPNGGFPIYYIDGLAPAPIYLQVGNGSNVALFGNNADETFKINALPPGVAISINGEGGNNTLDYSGYTGDVTVDLPLGYATGLAGGISNIRNVAGSIGNDILVGDGQANVLMGGTGRNILISGQGGGDTLIGGRGQNILIAGYTDDDLDVGALDAAMAQWIGGNAEPFALSQVHADTSPDALAGGGQNWFLYTVGEDQLSNVQSGDVLTAI